MAQNKTLQEQDVTNIMVFCLIFFGYNTMVMSNYIGEISSLIIIFFIAYLKTIYNRMFRMNFFVLICVLILYLNILVTMLFNQDLSNGNYLLILKIAAAFFVTCSFKFECFKRAYINTMVFLCAYSLIATYLLGHTFIANFVPTFTNSSGLQFYNFIFCNVINYPDYYRNFGVFTEPGIFVCYLIPALAFQFNDKEQNFKKKMASMFIFSITLISTFSPVGIIVALILFTTYLFTNKEMQKKYKFLICLLFIVLLTLILNEGSFFNSFINSINKLFEKQSSYTGRVFVLRNNIDIWLSSPLIGKGLSNVIYYINHYELIKVASSNTSTSTLYLAVYGLAFFLIHIFSIFYVFKTKKILITIIIFLSFILSINSQALFHSEFIWYLSLYGLERMNIIKKKAF